MNTQLARNIFSEHSAIAKKFWIFERFYAIDYLPTNQHAVNNFYHMVVQKLYIKQWYGNKGKINQL